MFGPWSKAEDKPLAAQPAGQQAFLAVAQPLLGPVGKPAVHDKELVAGGVLAVDLEPGPGRRVRQGGGQGGYGGGRRGQGGNKRGRGR